MTIPYRTLSAVLVLLAFTGRVAVPVAEQERTLTPSELDDAIRWGDTGEPSAYMLHHAQNKGTTNDGVVGLVYTPFVRVALAAKAAHDKGEHLDRADLPRTLVEPVVYIAFRWYCCDVDHGDMTSYHPLEPFDYHIAVPGRSGGLWWHIVARPLWTTRDLSRVAAWGALPYADVVLLAAYPVSALSQPSDFVIYREVPNPAFPEHPSTDMRIGRVTAADVRAWR